MEINREENNAKVAALYEVMYDLMNVLSMFDVSTYWTFFGSSDLH